MIRKRVPATLASAVLIAALTLIVLAACSSTAPTPSSSPAASPKASAPSSSPSSAAASPSAKPASAEQQAYQKSLDNWKTIVEAAQKEGEAVIYTVLDQASVDKFQAGFNKVDPKIQVKLMRMNGAQAIERLKAEQSTKQYVSNGYFGGSLTTRALSDQGLVQPVDGLPVLNEPGVPWIAPPLLDKPHATITFGYSNVMLLYNTTLVPAGQQPKTWKELSDPKWKDKLVLLDPRLNGPGQNVLTVLYNLPQSGPDLARKLIENTRLAPDTAEAARMVARGEVAVTAVNYQSYLAVKDAPVKVYIPEDGAIGNPTQIVVTKGAPQLNATKVFTNWFLDKEGQKINSEGLASNRTDIDFISKEAQIGGVKFMPGVPFSFEFEVRNHATLVEQVFRKMLDEMAK